MLTVSTTVAKIVDGVNRWDSRRRIVPFLKEAAMQTIISLRGLLKLATSALLIDVFAVEVMIKELVGAMTMHTGRMGCALSRSAEDFSMDLIVATQPGK